MSAATGQDSAIAGGEVLLRAQADRSAVAEAVFIVGTSRSGTTLMRRTLNSSDLIAVSSENHFLGHVVGSEGMRHKFRRFGDLSDDANVRRLVDYIYSDDFTRSSRFREVSSHWRWIVKRVEREELLQRILNSDRSERALFAIMMRVYADQKGKPIVGEKTPAHLRYVPTLLDWFPQARVIHMLRDPRAVFVSDLRRRSSEALSTPYKQLKQLGSGPLKLYILLHTTAIWLEARACHFRYQSLYPDRYSLLRFEDLVTDPEAQIKRICDFLGVEFQEKMLRQAVVSKGFQAGQVGFDARAADRWKTYIDPWANRWFSLVLRRPLREFQYDDSDSR